EGGGFGDRPGPRGRRGQARRGRERRDGGAMAAGRCRERHDGVVEPAQQPAVVLDVGDGAVLTGTGDSRRDEAAQRLMSRTCKVALIALALGAAPVRAQPTAKKPNILVMFGDDIGDWNVSAYNRGMMGYRTPNIDSIAKEGAIFTDVYAQQSCTAGRAAFITGQSPIRTGLLKVGLPGAPEGLSDKDPTIANLLKAQGYATGQFCKNHLGDRNNFFPTVHGFDEFFGNFYHLNAEQEPENPDYPKDPKFKAMFGPRGVYHCFATDTDDPTTDPRFGRVGKQK